jgi:hypothetical protein
MQDTRTTSEKLKDVEMMKQKIASALKPEVFNHSSKYFPLEIK